jgi:hypothetical protein
MSQQPKPLTPQERSDLAYKAPEQIDAFALLGRYEATVRKLEHDLNEANRYGFDVESERDAAEDRAWKATER